MRNAASTIQIVNCVADLIAACEGYGASVSYSSRTLKGRLFLPWSVILVTYGGVDYYFEHP